MNSGSVEAVPKMPSLYDEFLANTDPGRLQKILARYELFKLALPVKGSIVECGVFRGFGLMTWAHLSAVLEPACFAAVLLVLPLSCSTRFCSSVMVLYCTD